LNILHVLSQFEVTGAETFAATLANTQIANGYKVFIVSDNFYTKTNATVISHPIGKRDLPQRLENIIYLKNFIKENNIDVVHAHSRAASWVSYFATRLGYVPLVSSIHGRQHLHFSSKMFSVYGEKRVAVCKSIYTHLNHDLKYPLETLALINNGIDLTQWNFKSEVSFQQSKKIVSFVGRLSGMKGDALLHLIEEVFPKIYSQDNNIEFHIVGGMNEKQKILPTIQKINASIGADFIIAKGFTANVEQIYHSSDVIIGSGRVAMEALACGSIVITLGESNYVGVISEKTKDEAIATNFGDLDKRKPFDVNKIVNDILLALYHPEQIDRVWGRKFIEKEYEIKNICIQMNHVYAEARAIKKGITEIPILMYHRITNGIPEGTKHGIYVPRDQFERQLEFLKRRRFTALNYFDIRAIIDGKKDIPDKPVMLSFDDGYEDNYLIAFPLLKKYGMTATIFLIGNSAIRSNVWDEKNGEPAAKLLNDQQIKEMMNSGIEFGSHTMNHKKLNLCSIEEAEMEISESKKILEQRLNT
jgi:glycosyltransferase involved in cell wall biosynthesis